MAWAGSSHSVAYLGSFDCRSLGRCLWPFDWRTPTCFVDVLTGDILTSYARVLAEWDGLVQLALFPGSSRTGEEVTPWSLSPSGLSLLLIWYIGGRMMVVHDSDWACIAIRTFVG